MNENLNSNSNPKQVVDVLDDLRKNSKLGKHKHFAAADRYWFYNSFCGVTVTIINLVLGYLFFAEIFGLHILGAFLALYAAILSALQTFFNFQKVFEAHRRIGNKYLELASKCKHLKAKWSDGLIQLPELSDKIEELNKEYYDINENAQEFPTRKSDFKEAKQIEEEKKGKS
jgi:hypothetical protein